MDKQYLNDEFNRFFEFPTEDKSQVSSVSAKLFAEHIAYPLEREIEQLRQRVQELEERRCEVCGYAEHHREHTGCLRVKVKELTAERDALTKQRDELLESLEKVTAKLAWLNSDDCGHIMALTDESEALIASVKEKS